MTPYFALVMQILSEIEASAKGEADADALRSEMIRAVEKLRPATEIMRSRWNEHADDYYASVAHDTTVAEDA